MLSSAELSRIKAQTALAVRECGGQEACAEASGRITRHQSFSDFANLQLPDRVISLDTAAELDRFSGNPRFAQLLAQLAGGVFVPLPHGTGRWDIEQAAGRSVKEVGEVMIELGKSLGDGKLDEAERKALRPEIRDAIIALVQLDSVIAAAGEGDAE